VLADCRLCRHFVPLQYCSNKELEEVVSLANARGDKPLGYCRKYRRGVTYYIGKCPGFTGWEEKTYYTVPITKFIEG